MNFITKVYRLLILLMVFPLISFSQCANNYIIDLSDTSSFDLTCGSVNPSQWKVVNDSCNLSTPMLYVAGDSATDPSQEIIINFTLNPTGNMEADDNLYLQYQINDGTWMTFRTVNGDTVTSVFKVTQDMSIPAGATLRVRVVAQNNHNSEKWYIKDADIDICNAGLEWAPAIDGDGLPVELLFFYARAKEHTVSLEWATATEINNDYFSVERSQDGYNWEVVKKIDGAVNSYEYNYYSIEDELPLNGICYYRLKQIDLNKNYTYSKMQVVSFNPREFTMYPNPIEDNTVNVQLGYAYNEVIVAIYNSSGEQVYKTTEEGRTRNLNFHTNLPKGMYLIQIKYPDGSRHQEKIRFN